MTILPKTMQELLTVPASPDTVRIWESGARLGQSCAIDGDIIVIGDPSYMTPADWAGSAIIVERVGGVWTTIGRILNGVAQSDHVGQAVAVSGDTVAVGKPGEGLGGELDVGAVYVYTKVGGVWTLQQKLEGIPAENHPQYGSSLALEGDVLVMGTGTCANVYHYGDDAFGPPYLKGGAIGWTRSAGVWTSHIIPNAVADFDTDFGMGIALDVAGTRVAVSEPERTVGGFLNAGVVHIYLWDGANWVHEQTVAPLDPMTDGHFGAPAGSMALRGGYLFVGQPFGASSRGWVYVFKYSGGTWSQVDKFHAALTNQGGADGFGTGVCAPDASTLVVGAPSWSNVYASQVFFASQGAAWIFRTDAGWETDHNHETMITRKPPANWPNTGMGYSVSMDSNRQILLGMPYQQGVVLLNEAMIPTVVPEPPVGYLMQATDSVTGLLHYWPTNARDMAAVGYPGPNAAVDVAVSGIVEDISLDPMLGNDAYLMQGDRSLSYPYSPPRNWTSLFKDWQGTGWPDVNPPLNATICGYVHRIRRR